MFELRANGLRGCAHGARMLLQKLLELGDLVCTGPSARRSDAKAGGECDDGRRRDPKIHDALLM
jgi:hypothetical protein